jgi:hypothetical protein
LKQEDFDGSAGLLLRTTFFDEDREAEIDGLERRVVGAAGEQEVLRLEVTVHDPHEVADVDDGDDVAAHGGGLALGVGPLLRDAVEELPAGAELHDEVHALGVLEGALELGDVGLAAEVLQDGDLPAHVVDVGAARQLAPGHGLARVLEPRRALRALVRRPELPDPQPPLQLEQRAHVHHGPLQDRRAHVAGGRPPGHRSRARGEARRPGAVRGRRLRREGRPARGHRHVPRLALDRARLMVAVRPVRRPLRRLRLDGYLDLPGAAVAHGFCFSSCSLAQPGWLDLGKTGTTGWLESAAGVLSAPFARARDGRGRLHCNLQRLA